MKHKIVFFDMDGTLYQTENDVIQESALDAIQTLKDKGYIVCAATGRPLNQMKLILQRIQFERKLHSRQRLSRNRKLPNLTRQRE